MKRTFLIVFLLLVMSGHTQNADTIAIRNVNVIPMTAEVVLRNHDVWITDGRIIKVIPTANVNHKNHIVIDGSGKYLIPGLSEMHYHLRSGDIESDFKLLLANGITTVRNMAEFKDQDHISIRQKVAIGELFGPNYFTTGPYLTSADLRTEEDARSIVARHREKGYDFLKIADNLPKNIYLKLLDEGVKNHVSVVGHAQRNLPLEYSLRMKSIEHIEEFVYLTDEKKRPFFKLPQPDLMAQARHIKSSGIAIGTTLVVFDFINNCLDDKKFAAFQNDPLIKYIAREQRENFLTEKNDYRKLKGLEFDGVKAPKMFADYFGWIKKFTKILYENDVPLLSGSDTYGMVVVGFSLHKEFRLLQQCGLKPYDILRTATVNPAIYLNSFAVEGTVTDGKNANLILLQKNPLDDISNTQAIEGVFVKGRWLDRKKLDAMLKEVESAYK